MLEFFMVNIEIKTDLANSTWMKGDESMVEWGNEGPRRLAQVQRVEVPGFRAQLEGMEAFVELFPGLA